MNQRRTLPLLGPAAVLYLVTDVASGAPGPLDLVDRAVAAVAVAVALAAYFTPRAGEARGVRRLALLAAGAGLSLVGLVAVAVPSLPRDLVVAVASAVVGGAVLDLAVSVPDVPGAFRRRPLRTLAWVAAAAAALAGLLAAMPVVVLPDGEPLLFAARLAHVPPGFAFVALVLAQLVRTVRARLGSDAHALAANGWALLGLLPALVATAVAAALTASGLFPVGSAWVRGLVAAAAVTLVAGHVATVDPRRRFAVGPATRRAFAGLLAVGGVAGAVAAAPVAAPPDRFTLGVAVAALLIAGLVAFRLVEPVAAWLLAPSRGRLLAAVAEATARLDRARDLEAVAEAVLPPLRRASRDLAAEPLLYLRDPPREARIDAAGVPHVARAAAPDALVAYLGARLGEVLARATVEPLAVRRPDLRPVIDVLATLDAACVVPLALEGELEGLLVVPRGRRRRPLQLEELTALLALARRLAGLVAVIGGELRAQERSGTLTLERDRLEERLELFLDERAKMLTDARVLKAGRVEGDLAAPLVAYSLPMRALEARVREVAALEAPVLLVAPPGAAVERVANALHEASGRAEGGLVLGDCTAVPPERAAVALFGEAGVRSGWLELAAGGTLLLVDVPALPVEVQRELADALAARQARWAGDSPGGYPVDVRLVATARTRLDVLAEAGLFDEELAQRLSGLRLDVPPLRARGDDLRSLVWLGLSRAARALGRGPLGIEEEAFQALAAHDWPGDHQELVSVLDRAALAAPGPAIRLQDLPPFRGGEHAAAVEGARPPRATRPDAEAPALAPPPPVAAVLPNPLDGTYETVERRLLVRALERTGGNKSAAARLLGLKRTTFLDKVRRYELSS